MKEKIHVQVHKRLWSPSPLVSQVVLVTTLNEDGTSNIAPKSWLSMMAFQPATLALGCNLQHWTARNIIRSREFVINVPGAELAEIVWNSHKMPHPRTVEKVGLTPIPSVKVGPPSVEECKAHLECQLMDHIPYGDGDEVILIGEILAVSVDKQAFEAADPYAYLRAFVFLEDSKFGVVEASRRI